MHALKRNTSTYAHTYTCELYQARQRVDGPNGGVLPHGVQGPPRRFRSIERTGGVHPVRWRGCRGSARPVAPALPSCRWPYTGGTPVFPWSRLVVAASVFHSHAHRPREWSGPVYCMVAHAYVQFHCDHRDVCLSYISILRWQ